MNQPQRGRGRDEGGSLEGELMEVRGEKGEKGRGARRREIFGRSREREREREGEV